MWYNKPSPQTEPLFLQNNVSLVAAYGCVFVVKKIQKLGTNPSIHPSIHPLSTAHPGVGSRGQQLEQRSPDVPVPSHFLQLIRGDPVAFPGQPRDIVSPTCPGSSPGSSPGSPPSRTCKEHLTREASRSHPNQMPQPPHLAPLNTEEQRFYSEPLPDD